MAAAGRIEEVEAGRHYETRLVVVVWLVVTAGAAAVAVVVLGSVVG